MTFFSLIFALLLERWRRGAERNQAIALFLSLADSVERYFNTGVRRHAIAAWVTAVMPTSILCGWIYFLLFGIHPVLGWFWNILVLYFTTSFRPLSYSLTEIREALKTGDIFLARDLAERLHGVRGGDLSSQDISRIAIETGLVRSHRHLFGVIVGFALLPGPIGAVLYRQAELLNERWGGRADAFGEFATKAFEIIDWLPARATALSFAIAGNFEDAMYCWRAQAGSWADRNQGIILASGAGALGVCLGDSLRGAGGRYYRPEVGVGEDADLDFLQSAVGLIWRALMVWLFLLLLLEMAGLVA